MEGTRNVFRTTCSVFGKYSHRVWTVPAAFFGGGGGSFQRALVLPACSGILAFFRGGDTVCFRWFTQRFWGVSAACFFGFTHRVLGLSTAEFWSDLQGMTHQISGVVVTGFGVVSGSSLSSSRESLGRELGSRRRQQGFGESFRSRS